MSEPAREPGRPFEAVVLQSGELRPLAPGRARAFGERQGEVLVLREMTAAQLRSDRQLRYWFAVVVRFFIDQWERERGKRYSKEEVHGALMAAFGGGAVITPLGVSYPSSRFKTKREFVEITEAAREYAWQRYQSRIPTPDEWQEAA